MDRLIQKVLISRLEKWRSVALLGSRQVGKSYLLREILKNHSGTLISLDDPLEKQEAGRDPVRYLERRYRPGKYLFIDEAGRVPEIFSAVKILVDRHDPQPTGICLANSGNYLLMKKIKESLAGRVSLLSIYPFSWQELSLAKKRPGLIDMIQGKNLDTAISPSSFTAVERQREERMLWGGYPIPSLRDDQDARILWIRDYIRTYILPLVIEQFNIRETSAFEQAARLLMLQSAQFLNVNKLARSIGVSQPTAKNFIYFLDAMMVIRQVPVFYRNPTKRLVRHPKIYAGDELLFNECLGSNFSIQKATERNEIGRIYELFIFNEINKTIMNYDLFAEFYTWRTQDRAEVDIVLSTSQGIIPLEVKWSKCLTRKDLSGLVSFMKCYPEVKKGFIVYPGEKIEQISENIIAVPDWWMLGCF